MRWIADNVVGSRYRFWTRANVNEVFPEPLSPLGWDLGWERACLTGWRDLYLQRLGMEEHELSRERNETLGIFGGYAYLGAGLFRVWAGRTPGMTPTSIDEAYFGDHPDVPPYVEEDWHKNPRTTEAMGRWFGWVTGEMSQDELEADREESLLVRANRPDLSAISDEALLGRALSLCPLLRRLSDQHSNQSIAASVGPGILRQICTSIGRPEWAVSLIAGIGGVDSALPVYAMWELSRMVAGSAELTELFDAGVGDVDRRLRQAGSAGPEVTAFVAAFDEFLAEFGSRGTNEWDLIGAAWEVQPSSVLAAIDRMRLADDASSPIVEHEARVANRVALEQEIREALAGSDEALGALDVGLRATATFVPGRERSKTSIIRVLHEARMATRELGHRFAARGMLDEPLDVYLLFVDELEDLVADALPGAAELAAARREYRTWLAGLEPPFIINGPPPQNTTWPRRAAGAFVPLGLGESITGVPGSPGQAAGRARTVHDPSDAGALQPGEVLVAATTDPSWTPLFVGAAAVVVDVGTALSHAVIVSRELGIPCVPAAPHASRRIPDGALVRVDGDNGTVTLVELP